MATVVIEDNAEMKTRDGVILRADVYRPDTSEPVPGILLRTPYDKSRRNATRMWVNPVTAARNGFACVVQDVRGRFASDGDYSPITLHEGPDGYDAIQWVAEQEWCTGAVGTMGISYESLVQFMAAEEQPPALKAIIPEFSGDAARGALMLDATLISWAAGQAVDWLTKQTVLGKASPADLEVVMAAMADPQSAARHLPPAEMPLMKVSELYTYAEMLAVLRGAARVRPSLITVPTLMIGGWWDIDPLGCLNIMRGIWSEAATAEARAESAVVWGPWEHGVANDFLGEWHFGAHAHSFAPAIDLTGLCLSFLDRHLRGNRDALVPQATYFMTGANTWQRAESWPPPSLTPQTLWLTSNGNANSSAGDGELSNEPGGSAANDTFHYDPHDPVLSFGGRFFRVGGSLPGPFDQHRVEDRSDVLVFTSPVLDAPLTMVGDVTAVLHFATDGPDTDVAVKLCDVSPEERSHNIADNFVRLRWRDGIDEERLLAPGELLELRIELSPVAHVFRPGHQIRLQVTSSNFPAYDRSMNTDKPEGSDPVGRTATQTLWHDAQHPSRLEFSVAPS